MRIEEHFFILIGVSLVLFLAMLLLTAKRYKSRPNTYLAISILMLTIIILKVNGIMAETWFDEVFNFLRIEYLFSPLLYIYVSSCLHKPIKKSTYIALFVPFTVFSTLYTFVWFSDHNSFNLFNGLLEYIEPFEIYFIIAFNFIVILLFTLKVQKSDSANSFKSWIYVIAFGLIALLSSFFILEIVELLFDTYYGNYITIGFSLFFILLTYFGVQQLQVEKERKIIERIYNSKHTNTSKEKSSITLDHFEHIQLLMKDEQLYKDTNLDREILAAKLGLSPSSITRILKAEGQMSFSGYVNKYRINLAKEMLADERFNIFSIEAIGKEVGFKSRSAFYNTFKKEVGISPGAFKKQ
ncbi:MAG: helix-turn-helix domain-containing protein [Bacteroidota bacterium]